MNYTGYKPIIARYSLDINLGWLQKNSPNSSLVVFPNPIKNQAYLRFTLLKSENISIQLFDMQGQLVKSYILNKQQNAGEHQFPLLFDADIKPGNYILRVSASSFQTQVQITKISH